MPPAQTTTTTLTQFDHCNMAAYATGFPTKQTTKAKDNDRQQQDDSQSSNKRSSLQLNRGTVTTVATNTANKLNNGKNKKEDYIRAHRARSGSNRNLHYNRAQSWKLQTTTNRRRRVAIAATTTTMLSTARHLAATPLQISTTSPEFPISSHPSTLPASPTATPTPPVLTPRTPRTTLGDNHPVYSTCANSSVASSFCSAATRASSMVSGLLLNATLLAADKVLTTAATLSALTIAGAAITADTVDGNLTLLNPDANASDGDLSATTNFVNGSGRFAEAGFGVRSVVGAAGGSGFNNSDELTEQKAEYVFDRTDVRIIFITLYTLVFCCCFFGNLLVILVVTLSRRLRSITNFFLANLALADFCVGLFCVMQNLSIYLIDSWVFGEFMCRMYQFVHSLSYTASIFILVVICMERYFAIVHPITCKQILTAARLRMVILTVWITSAVYSTPKFVFSKTIKNIHTADGQEEEICVLDRKMFNSKLLDMINFVLLYVIPLLVMTVLYSKIAIALWRSSRGFSHHNAQQEENSMTMHNSMYHHNHQQQQVQHLHNHHHPNHPSHQLQQHSSGGSISGSSVGMLSRKQSSKCEKRGINVSESKNDNCQISLDAERPVVSACRKTSFYNHSHHGPRHGQGAQRMAATAHMSHSSNNVLRARRGVVRMLIIFVLTFALCNLPYHARKMWQYWSRSYRGDSNFNALLTPLTFLVTYFNSGVNPLLYAFLSRNFRKGMKELLLCSWKKGKGKSSSNSSMHHKRMALQTHSLPTDTTHIGNEQL